MKKQFTLITFALLALVSLAQVPSYVPTNGLLGWWPFNGNANDESGNGNNGTVSGATLTADRNGIVNSAYYFDYTSEITTNFYGISGTQSRTISFWMKNQYSNKTISPIWYGGNSSTAIIGAAFNIIFNRNEQSDQCGCWPTTSEGIGVNADWVYSLKSAIVGDNQWHNWIVSLENSGDNFNQVKYYKDGILITSAIIFDYNGNGATTVNTINQIGLKFGKSWGNGSNPDKAPTQFLDDIGIWNRALTQQEITNLYTSSVPPTCSITASASAVCAGGNVILSQNSDLDTVLFDSFSMQFNSSFNYSTGNTVAGRQYIIHVSGMWGIANNSIHRDAAYNLNSGGGSLYTQTPISTTCDACWLLNGSFGHRPVPDVYSPTHNYTYYYTGNGLPINFSFFDSAYGDNTGTLDFMIQEVSPISYLWSNGATTPSITVSPTSTTTYTCTVTTNGQSCSSSQTIEVLQPTITATTDAICTGQSTTLTAAMPVNSACPSLNGTLTNGLVGYWPFCGNANDASGNGNNGTVNGATLTTDRFGNANSAYSFDGVLGQEISGTLNQPITNQFSVSAWALKNDINTSTYPYNLNQWVFAFGTPFTNNGFHLGLYGNNPSVIYGTWDYAQTSNAQYTNNWELYNVVYNNGVYTIYKNGILINTVNSNISLIGNSFKIGNQIGSHIEFWNGKLDDIGIWNRALTPAEIQQLYNQGQPTYSWSPGGATTPSITVSPTSTTTYTCTVTTNGQSCSSSQTIQVLQPVITTTSNAICSGQSTTLTAAMPVSTACPSLNGTLTNGLIGYWPFCGNANDASGNGNNGTVNGATLTTDRFGNANSAYSFDGNSRIEVLNSTHPTGNLNVTYSVWLYPTTLNTVNAEGIMCIGSITSTNGASAIFCRSNFIYYTQAYNDAPHSYNLPLNSWSQITMIKNSLNETFLYVNGIFISQISTNPGQNLSNTKISFGYNGNSNHNSGEYYSGKLDDIAIWNRALTASEIQQLYNQGQPTYSWSPGGATTPSITVSPTSTTTYTCTVTTNGQSCSSSQTITVNPLPTVNAGNDQTVCAGTSVTLSGSGANTYSWNNGVTNGVAFIPTATTTYTLTGTNTATGCTNTDQVTVNVNALPAVNAGADQTVCAGTSVTLSGTGANTYSWNNGVTNGVAFIPTATTTYTVTGTNSTTGCTNTDQVTVNVNALPAVNAGADQTVCAGTSVTLSGTGANTYSWNNGVTNGVAFIPTATTTYTLTGTNTTTGCTNTDQVTVNVNALPAVNAGLDQALCQGQSTTLFASGADTYNWTNNVINGVGFLPTATQEYVVTGTNTATGCINSDTLTVIVNDLPTVDAGADMTICRGDTILLSGSGALSYTWNNNVVNGQEFVPATTQTYQVVGTDNNNCQSSDTVTVTVNDPTFSTLTETALDSYTLNGITYTQSGTYTQVLTNAAGCDSTITLNLTLNFTGVVELDYDIVVSPNPTWNTFMIRSQTEIVSSFSIFDAQGRIVQQGKLQGKETMIDISMAQPGNYILEISDYQMKVRITKM